MKSAEKLQGKKAGLSWKVKDWIAGYVFIAPVTIGLMVFYILALHPKLLVQF